MHRPVDQVINSDFRISGIAFGTIVALGGWHLLRWLAPEHMRADLDRERPLREVRLGADRRPDQRGPGEREPEPTG